MNVYIFCTIPDLLRSPLETGVLERAGRAGALEVQVYDLHDFSPDPHRKIDDFSYGGGPGMVLRVDVVATALETVFGDDATSVRNRIPVILLSPRGERFTQARARELATHEEIAVICGRYEGVDERVREHLANFELSIGDYVLSGGEIAAAVVTEAVARLLPGVLGNAQSLTEESFTGPRLEYPQYTRPASFRGWDVPAVLLSGDHARVKRWREEKSMELTRDRRPDLLDG